ncbi:hypothetical protein [Campylobacter corcagiensis]|uniref:Potassium transporter TrkA n=1 Tax=Campylobacter corcagiensis TaxID=1448857 RepID=A0A7M1LGR4_9BACT|nr:hypothetical protein [Campylobacter corcagiensis]QKF64791.1 TrkA domain-containing protein [Campylobacter corcagiensis]QOQ87046.1 potassium transporter TrkA [Campylobacter corcagiensis]
MKNIMIICDGILAKNFLEKIVTLKNLRHNYTIIYNSDETISENIVGDNLTLEKFDATSLPRLKVALSKKFDTFMIIQDNKFNTINIYKNLREILPDVEIYLLDAWDDFSDRLDDKHLKSVDLLDIITSRLVGYLPDHPILADDIGLGSGEIMEAKVPVGSSFAYKRVGMFTNQKYKIPMIYRHNEAIVTKYNTMIFPNDTILMVGEPSVLKDVYTTIKTARGQFPSPFGINFYLIIDMARTEKNEILKMIKSAKFLNETLTNHKLFIRIINPTTLDSVKELTSDCDGLSCEIMVEYKEQVSIMDKDVKHHKIGMIISNNEFFERYKKRVFNLKVPILTLGDKDVSNLKKGVVIVNNKSSTTGASVVFDLCGQLGLDISLYYYDQIEKDEVIGYYKDLSELFKKELFITNNSEINPLNTLYEESDFLQFVPFNESVLKRNLLSNLSKDIDELYFKLKSNYQLFIPDFSEI